MLILFSFAFDPKTKGLTYNMNIEPKAVWLPMALKILQNALIEQARQQGDGKKPSKPKEVQSEKGNLT